MVGSPAASMAMALLDGLLECDIGGKSKDEIKLYIEKVQPSAGGVATIQKQDIELVVQAVRVEKTHDETTAKVVVAAPFWELRGIVTRAYLNEGVATRHTGPAPAGWLEDEMSMWLDAIS